MEMRNRFYTISEEDGVYNIEYKEIPKDMDYETFKMFLSTYASAYDYFT